jgi:hypothetical protein
LFALTNLTVSPRLQSPRQQGSSLFRTAECLVVRRAICMLCLHSSSFLYFFAFVSGTSAELTLTNSDVLKFSTNTPNTKSKVSQPHNDVLVASSPNKAPSSRFTEHTKHNNGDLLRQSQGQQHDCQQERRSWRSCHVRHWRCKCPATMMTVCQC